ncbi:MAG: hypothetical protein ABSC18_03360 [Verrucomicrobiota bacterium]|jgi:hypothetical protein
MPQNNHDTLVDLPKGLRGQFEKAAQRLWRVETATAACGIAASLLFSWLAVFISDRLWETPVWLRAFIFLGGLGGAAAALLAWARHWIWRRRDLRALAALVQKKYRRLGDRLLGIVELANEREHLSNFSPALYQAAIAQVAEEAQEFDFRQSVNARPAKNSGWTAAALALCLLAASLALPQASWNAWLRWIEPGASVPRYTLVVLDGFQPELIVPHGEPFEISGTVRYRSFWKPSRVFAGFGRRAGIQAAAQSGQVRLQIPGQVENGVLQVRVGDALARVAIRPSHRPSLQQLSASIHWPDYLRYPDQSEPVQGGTFRALEGSRVSFVGTVSRPLAAASMQDGGQNPVALPVKGPTFSTEPAEAAAADELVFNWRDQLGLTNAAPWRLALQQESDQPPQPELPDQPRTTAILVSDVMRIREAAQDDFGVRDLGLAWDVVSEAGQPDTLLSEIKAEMTSPQQKKVEDIFLWSPSLYHIPADSTVELQGFAQDYFPKRQPVHTASYVIRVLSPESHAELLRQDLEALMAQIEDVTRLQEKIVSDTREVKESSKELPGEQPFARLTQSHDEQLQNAQRLAELGRQGEDTVREAMKNSLIPEETIRQWSQTLQQWQELSADKMPEAARAMMSAAQDAKSRPAPQSASSQDQNSPSPQSQNEGREGTNGRNGGPNSPSPQSPNPPSQPRNSQSPQARNPPSQPPDAQAREENAKRLEQELADAEKRAEEVLEALRKMEQNANQNLDQLQALTLAERLRKVGGEETGLSGQLTTNLADTIGLPPRELPEKFQRLNTAFVKRQGGAHDESAALQAEISRFYERTQKPNYGKVSQDMKDSHTSDELDRIGGLIQSNVAVQSSVNLAAWSARFQKWADDLQPKPDPGGQSQSGNGQPPLDLTRQLIALLRLREKESTLRDQTGVLEWSKDITPDYKEQAGALAATQDNLGQALALIHQATPLPALDPPFDQAAAAMQEARALLAKPQTDAVTDGTEARSVDTLSDLINLINEQAQRGQPGRQGQPSEQAGGASAEEMAFLTGMMRNGSQNGPPGMQPMGRGNLSGGTTDQEGRPVTGDAGGRGAAGRIVNKAAGVIQNAPAEFRDALENYFHNVEKLKD